MVILAEKQQIPAIYAFKSTLTLEQIVLWCVSWVLTESEWHDGKILTKAQKGDCSSLIAGVWRVFLSSSLFLLLLLYSCNSHHKAASGCFMVAELLAPWLVLHLRDTEKCVLGASFFFFLFSFFSCWFMWVASPFFTSLPTYVCYADVVHSKSWRGWQGCKHIYVECISVGQVSLRVVTLSHKSLFL